MSSQSEKNASPPSAAIEVPFYANHPDKQHCILAVYRMVLKHSLGKELSWEQLEALSGYQSGKAAWSPKPLTTLVTEFGLSVRMIEPFDYRRFAKEGISYFYSQYDNKEVEWQLQHTNLPDIAPHISAFLAAVRPECRRAKLEDIDTMLADGQLVAVVLNGKGLEGLEGYRGHTVLVIDCEGDDYIIHDPGPPGQPYRHVSRSLLWKAMGGEQNIAEINGFKLRKAGLRLDQYVVREKPMLSRAYAARLIAEGRILVNGQINKAGYKLRDADTITIDYNEADEPQVPDIDLPILYEDDDCIVIDKPAGVLTHNKGVRFVEATVASFVRSRTKLWEGERPGIVHRLDRATSGVIICAKNPQALSWLQKQFHDRLVKKSYAAIITGSLEPAEAIIDMPIERNPKTPASFRVGANGKSAQTRYKVAQTSIDGNHSILELQPATGRTHQLRVHLAHHHHPIVGDVLYSGEPADRMYLHAHTLTITLPNGQKKIFEAPLPSSFQAKLQETQPAATNTKGK
jgi:23S rRNA pseudouridine1911/1915/1917 synthase